MAPQPADTSLTTVANAKLRFLIRSHETLKVLRVDKQLCDSENVLLTGQLANRDSVIGKYIRLGQLKDSIAADYEIELREAGQIQAASTKYITTLTRQVRAGKLKFDLAVGLGGLCLAGLVYEVFHH